MLKINILSNKTNSFNQDTVISVGSFDGIHLAHNQILKTLNKISKKDNLQSLIFTFTESPKNFFSEKKNKIITTNKEKTSILNSKNIDNIFFQKFNKTFANLSAEQFLKNILINKLNLRTLVIGDDHKFGKNQKGNFENLSLLGKKYNFKVEQIDSFFVDKTRVSSTNIRNALSKGDIKTANSLLGYNYFLTGKVVSGKQIGRKIGFPTANLSVHPDKLIPKEGVYAVLAKINNKQYSAMCNIGNRPTINMSKKKIIEVHIINFNGDLYNKEIQVHFSTKIRKELKFDGVEKLVEQLKKDKFYTTNHFSKLLN